MTKKESNKIIISISLIDQTAFGNSSFDDIASIIIDQENFENQLETRFEEQQILENNFPDYSIRVFHAIKARKPQWVNFFKDVVVKDQPLLKSINRDAAFIAFIGYKGYVFGISGGHGNIALLRHSVQDFGIEILSRLVEKDNRVIRSLQDRVVMGSLLGERKFYRDTQSFIDEDQFGKIFKEVFAGLNKTILSDIFGFSAKELTRQFSGFIAKSSFQINKSISFESLLRIISKTVSLLRNVPPNFNFNKVILIDKRKYNGTELINKLNEALAEKLYKSYLESENPGFDFCNKDYEGYYSAQKFTIKRYDVTIKEYDEVFTLSELQSDLAKDKFILSDNIDNFRHSFLYAQIESWDGFGNKLTSAKVLEHFHGEIDLENKKYFYVDEQWYRIHNDFINELNIECKDAIYQAWGEDVITEKFALGQVEKDFNALFINKPSFLVFDTITYENIELCDILKQDEDNIYLIHVKKGFDNSIRELSSQVLMAAKRLMSDLKTNGSFISRIEEKAKAGKKSKSLYLNSIGSQNFPLKGVKHLLESVLTRNIVFCLAFVDTGKKARSLKDSPELFESTVAKQLVLDLRKQLNTMGFGFRVIQLKKD